MSLFISINIIQRVCEWFRLLFEKSIRRYQSYFMNIFFMNVVSYLYSCSDMTYLKSINEQLNSLSIHFQFSIKKLSSIIKETSSWFHFNSLIILLPYDEFLTMMFHDIEEYLFLLLIWEIVIKLIHFDKVIIIIHVIVNVMSIGIVLVISILRSQLVIQQVSLVQSNQHLKGSHLLPHVFRPFYLQSA